MKTDEKFELMKHEMTRYSENEITFDWFQDF